jgi:hypothetical protein
MRLKAIHRRFDQRPKTRARGGTDAGLPEEAIPAAEWNDVDQLPYTFEQRS